MELFHKMSCLKRNDDSKSTQIRFNSFALHVLIVPFNAMFDFKS